MAPLLNDQTTTQKRAENIPYQKQLVAVEQCEDYEWVSPFTPERIDPKVGTKETLVKFPTKSELRAVIPPHCFERPLWRSMFYVIKDIFQGALVVYIVHNVIGLSTDPPTEGDAGIWQWLLWRLGWNIYAVVMAMAVGGLWIVGHECGHGAFSQYAWVNGTVGWTLHSAMLVPYFTWAFSHAKHHRRTNDLVEGETHVPSLYDDVGLKKKQQSTAADKKKKTTTNSYEYERASSEEVVSTLFGKGPHQFFTNLFYGDAKLHEIMGDDVFWNFYLYSRLFFLWQVYLCGIKSTAHLSYDGKPIPKGTWSDHFRPDSVLFPPKMYWKVVASDLGCVITLTVLGICSYLYGFRAVWFWYGGPYIVIHAFLVTVTWLQHADPTVPHFDADNWTWMKGALAGTIDRPMYGWINYCSHNISTTHVLHHCFHTIPHYHAVEATKAIREFLEPQGLYNFDDTPLEDAMMKVAERCHFVDSINDGVQYYQSILDVPLTEDANKIKQS